MSRLPLGLQLPAFDVGSKIIFADMLAEVVKVDGDSRLVRFEDQSELWVNLLTDVNKHLIMQRADADPVTLLKATHTKYMRLLASVDPRSPVNILTPAPGKARWGYVVYCTPERLETVRTQLPESVEGVPVHVEAR